MSNLTCLILNVGQMAGSLYIQAHEAIENVKNGGPLSRISYSYQLKANIVCF